MVSLLQIWDIHFYLYTESILHDKNKHHTWFDPVVFVIGSVCSNESVLLLQIIRADRKPKDWVLALGRLTLRRLSNGGKDSWLTQVKRGKDLKQ